VTDLYRIGIKFFAENSAAVRIKEFVPIFHSWIQRQAIDEHQLIDVHDYSHVHNGPGILLVAHEGNFSTDMAEGKLGVAYFRKLPASVSTEDALRATLKAARQGIALLEAEPALAGKLRFRQDELLILSNDRLLAPNEPKSLDALKATLAAVFGKSATFKHLSEGTKDRLTIQVKLR
jgi:hypothetical protein